MAAKIDSKKQDKYPFAPRRETRLVEVPKLRHLMVGG